MSYFKNAVVLKDCSPNLQSDLEKHWLNTLGRIGLFDSKNDFCENTENLSGKNLALRWHLALRLLKGQHEDGMDGMDRDGGDLRQIGRRLDRQNWPLA